MHCSLTAFQDFFSSLNCAVAYMYSVLSIVGLPALALMNKRQARPFVRNVLSHLAAMRKDMTFFVLFGIICTDYLVGTVLYGLDSGLRSRAKLRKPAKLGGAQIDCSATTRYYEGSRFSGGRKHG